MQEPTIQSMFDGHQLFIQQLLLDPIFCNYSELLNRGFVYTSASGESYRVGRILPEDSNTIRQAIALSVQEPAVLDLETPTIDGLARRGLALAIWTTNHQLAAFQGAELLPEYEISQRASSSMPTCEVRSGLTHPGYRGHGLNTVLKKLQIPNIIMQYGLWPVGFTDNIPTPGSESHIASMSTGILGKLGFQGEYIKDLPLEWQTSLVQPCPEGLCALRGDHNAVPCSCQLWLPPTKQQIVTNLVEVLQVLKPL